MTHFRLLIFAIVIGNNTMAQSLNFSQTVNALFFGVDISSNTNSILDSLNSRKELHFQYDGSRQFNVNVTLDMNSSEAWSSKRIYTFSQSPLEKLQFDSGIITVRVGETHSVKKILEIFLVLEFKTRTQAIENFELLCQKFDKLSTNKKVEVENGSKIAQFCSRNESDKGIRDIAIFLNKEADSGRYKILLMLGSDFME